MGRLYVPKPPKKRKNGVAKSKIIARAVFDALSISKTLVPVASRPIPRVCPPLYLAITFLVMRFLFHLTFSFGMREPMLRIQPFSTARD